MKALKAYNTEAITRFHQRKVHNTEIVETPQDDPLWNFGAYCVELSSSIHQLVGLGGLFCQLNVTEQGSLVTTI